MLFENLIRYKTLHQVYTSGNPQLVDRILEQNEGVPGVAVGSDILVKKLQFDASQERFDEVEEICNLLGMSKREFMDSAVHDAVHVARHIIEEYGYLDGGVEC